MERKKKTRIRRKNGGIRKAVIFLILLFIIIQLFIRVIVPASVTFSRYVYATIRNYYLNSKEFYFNSDKLSMTTAHFESNNWSGVSEYEVTINMNSKNNANEFSKVDINYNIEYEYKVYKSDGTEYEDDLIDFYLTGSENVAEGEIISRTIFADSGNMDSFDFSIKPLTDANLQNDDYVLVKITATATDPYVSTLTGEFKIIIGRLGMSYKIEDEPYSSYMEVIVTNTLDYYIVDEAFGNYSQNNKLTITEYANLTEEEKQKCHSMYINLSFDPNIVLLDTTSEIYLDADKTSNDITYTDKNGNTYVNSITFKIDAEESKVIKFYKVVAADDYTYPNSSEDEPKVLVTSS